MSDAASADEPARSAEFDARCPADTLGAALEAVGAVVEECVLRVGPEGLTVDAQDPATVAIVAVAVPADAFDAYHATDTRLGVDLDRLRDVVGMADADEPVRLRVEPGGRTLGVRVGELSYTLGLLDPDSVRSPPEDYDFSDAYAARVTLPGEGIADAVRAADMVADHLGLGVDAGDEADAGDGHLYATAEGDTDSVRLEFPAEDCDRFEPGPAHSLFSVSYLDAVAGVLPGDAAVTVRLGEEAPVGLSFETAGVDVDYVVAPRISRS